MKVEKNHRIKSTFITMISTSFIMTKLSRLMITMIVILYPRKLLIIRISLTNSTFRAVIIFFQPLWLYMKLSNNIIGFIMRIVKITKNRGKVIISSFFVLWKLAIGLDKHATSIFDIACGNSVIENTKWKEEIVNSHTGNKTKKW